jgi:hypothetical protein
MFPKNKKELKELSKSYFMDIIEKYQKAELENNKELFNKYLKERIVKESKFEALIITDIYIIQHINVLLKIVIQLFVIIV